ncbi:fimbrillin family protein [Prevotella sp. FD3004]|uniref:fimbrillin family protein n=1 Tax=Prevotella sp. FD3004 TaxID=1408309 RepID=UPI0009DED594|nr:fimbrillin family protein [Prevotella sp. FD3004]
MNMKTNITIIVALLLLGACTSYEERRAVSPMSIQLTASVAAETLSPGDATAWSREAWKELTSRRATRGLYETAIANGEKVYVWADKGSAGTYAFLKAWTLTSDGSGGLTGSTKYYPSDGDGLTFRAVHGNFSTAPAEGTAIGTLTHTVLADQSATGNYEKSDLHYGEGSGSYETVGSAPLNFTHKLSKIEVNLTAGIGLIPSNVTNVTVKVRNVKPSITINPSTGALGTASGTATTITARHTGNGVFEAVIPPQAAPSGVLTITMGNVTVTVPNTVATFAENAKYIYNVKCDNKDKRLNPLWYVAENNVKSYNYSTKVVTLETNPAAAGSAQCYSWYDAMGYFSKTGSSYDTYWAGDITDGTTGFKYHLPTLKEWYSVLPVSDEVFNSTDFQPSGGLVGSAPACIFGYSDDTKAGIADWSYWSTYTTANVRYALRFLGTPYCSAWKYEFNASTHVMTITAKLIDYLDKNDATLGTKLAAYMNDASFWTSLNEDEGALKRQFYAAGWRYDNGSLISGAADSQLNTFGIHWSTKEYTENSHSYVRRFSFGNGNLWVDKCIDTYYIPNSFLVRLFRNEGVGEARIDPGVALTSSSIKPGWVIVENGKAYPYGTLAQVHNHTVKAVVVYVGAAGSADASSSVYRGLAISMKDTHVGIIWGPTGQDAGLTKRTTLSSAISDMTGISSTNTLVARYPTGAAAGAYAPSFASGLSNWFLPGVGQWVKVLNTFGAGITTSSNGGAFGSVTSGSVNISVINDLSSKLIISGAERIVQHRNYWTTSENSINNVVRVAFGGESGMIIDNFPTKTMDFLAVRAFIAF